MNKNPEIAKKIKEIRLERNLSQDRFGKKIGVSGKTVSAYENGKCTPTFSVLDSISQVYDVTFLHLKKSKEEQLREKIQNVREIIEDLESTLLSSSKE
jgi:repressor LexA